MAEQGRNCYVYVGGKKQGPFSEEQLQTYYAQKKINDETKFTRLGMKEWIPLSESGVIKSEAADGGGAANVIPAGKGKKALIIAVSILILCLVIWFVNSSLFILLVILAVIVAVIYAIYYFNKPQCPNCKKRKCEKTSSIAAGYENIQVEKDNVIKHYDKGKIPGWHEPDSLSVEKIQVDGIRQYYDVTYKCKECGEIYSRREYEDRER